MRYKKGIQKCYLSGGMTGIKDFNFPAFNSLAGRLEAKGIKVFNPAEKGSVDTSRPWTTMMKIAITEMMKTDKVVVLPGWQKSKGALIEVKLAKSLGMEVIEESGKPIKGFDIWIGNWFSLMRVLGLI